MQRLCYGLLFLTTIVIITSCNTPVPMRAPGLSHENARPTAVPTPVLPPIRSYQTGMVAPNWAKNAYSQITPELRQIKQQTDSRWIELPILLQQATNASDTVTVSPNQVTPASLALGIEQAHALGLRVFVVPLLSVSITGDWSGTVIPANLSVWFSSYWHALAPYVQIAVLEHADQFSLGTEINWIQNNAPSALWTELITQVTSTYHGRLTYDTNWSEIYKAVPSWMLDTRITALGVSEYIDLINYAGYVDPEAIPDLWKKVVQEPLDEFAVSTGKPVIISEIGYRDRADALYQTWSTTSSAAKAPEEQAGAFSAALYDLQGDHSIIGFYPWGWSNVGDMSIQGSQAARTIKQMYSTM